jgi:hypothetical protein
MYKSKYDCQNGVNVMFETSIILMYRLSNIVFWIKEDILTVQDTK